MKISLVVLALNEIDGLKLIMPRVDKSLFEQIILLDGGSTDGSAQWAKDNGYEVYVQKKKGIRNAHLESLDMIRGDVILTFSPDNNCTPEDLPMIIDEMKKGYDLVIASRYKGNIKSDDDDIITQFGNWFFQTIIRIFHGKNYIYSDPMTIYRIFKKEIYYKLDMLDEKYYAIPERLFFTNIGWEALMSVRAAKANLKISEVPSVELARVGGVRKLQIIRWGLSYFYQVLAEIFIWKKKF
jgi:glycosyltransferase involved in cell wall biosynthesis